MKNFRKTILWKKSYLWLTMLFFMVSLALHWVFGWKAFKEEEIENGHVPQVQTYLTEMTRDTMENWQSEFLQLMWQVCGLAMFLYVGSPSSKEGDERKEAKIDHILKVVDPENYEKIQRQLKEKYPES
jgi:hypothetical protein